RRFIVGIGGSATNDGGAGMLQALGFRLLDGNGCDIPRGGGGLAALASIDRSTAIPELGECVFRIACDVENPLCGERGASAVFGPQKGATPEMVAELDAALAHFSAVSGGNAEVPGSGAAGGLGFAFREFLGGELKSGIEIVLEETRFEDFVRDADIVVTGEGRLDSQTVMGKAPIGVARAAKKFGGKVIAFSGCVTPDAGVVNEHGIDAFFPILRQVTTLEEALEKGHAAENLAATAEQVFRCFRLGAH
ncbi:MAG: glycerate kinase, partial [Kiritimatiellae bacterium]|nr:glycerate kinase [Kiritimatiellia bacterium]